MSLLLRAGFGTLRVRIFDVPAWALRLSSGTVSYPTHRGKTDLDFAVPIGGKTVALATKAVARPVPSKKTSEGKNSCEYGFAT